MNIERIDCRISKWTTYLEGMKEGGRLITRSELGGIIDTITVHWVGAFPSQRPEDTIKYWNEDDNYHSTQYIIKDTRTVQAFDDNIICWHTGAALDTAARSIGVEVFPYNVAGEFSYTSRETLKLLINYLKEKYPIKTINRHYDWSKKECPRYYTPFVEGGEDRWQELKAYLEA